jgi:hypothetical protein
VAFYNVSLVGHGPDAKLISKFLSKGKQYNGNIILDDHFEDLNNHDFILLRLKSKREAVLALPLIYHISNYDDPSSSGDFQTAELTGSMVPNVSLAHYMTVLSLVSSERSLHSS